VSRVDTPVAPVSTVVPGVRSGGFVEWTIPTANSLPGGLSQSEDNALLFTERTGNKIGLLRLEDH
jgi:hypothetical protein